MLDKVSKAALLGTAIVWVMASNAASAQDRSEDPSERAMVEDIIVTATRTGETNLQNTPIAVTALSAGALREKAIVSLQEVSTYAPGLSIGQRGGGAAAIAMRGMGVDALDSAAAVGIYVDDVYFASGRGSILSLMDVSRVEVLRGPQGTLFGRNTIAGAIQIVTEDPKSTLGGYVAGTIGNVGRRNVEGAINLPLTDTLAVRFAGQYSRRGGYVRDLFTGEDRGKDQTWAARGKLKWTPTDRLTVDLKGEYLREKTNGRAILVGDVNPNSQFPALATAFGETRPLDSSYISTETDPGDYAFAGFNGPDFLRFKSYVAQGIINYELSDAFSLRSITARSWYRSALSQDLDNTPLSILHVAQGTERIDVFTQEMQLNGKLLNDRLNLTVGGYYYDGQVRQVPGTIVTIGFFPPASPYGNPAQDQLAKALYGQATFNLTDQLSVSGGLRYSNEKIQARIADSGLPEASVTYSDWSPYFGVNFQVTPDVLFYAKASKGFRAGGFTPALALIPAGFPSGNRPYRPETAWSYEVGARMEFLDRRLRINPTLFLTDWKNIQFNSILVVGNDPVPVTNNAGDARLKGFELETQFAATPRLTLSGTLALLGSHYTRADPIPHAIFPTGWTILAGPPFIIPNSVAVVQDITLNTKLARAPKVKFTAGARYRYPLASGGSLTANIDYAWTDDQSSSAAFTSAVNMPANGQLSARLQFDAPDSAFSIAVYGTNLTNEYYLVGATDYAAGYTAGTQELDVGRPREFGVEARVRF